MTEQVQILLTGLNHKTAPVELRERLSFGRTSMAPAVRELVNDVGLDEAVLLSTCNRTEIYGTACTDPGIAQNCLCEWLALRAEMRPKKLDRHLYHQTGALAVEHLLRVAAGLDSLVLGEPHILGQVSAAFESARQAGTANGRLSKLFRSAVETGRSVRTETALGAMPISVASVAVQLVERVFGDLQRRSVLVIGAGEICSAAASHLAERTPARLIVINRTASRAEDLAARCCGHAAPWSSLSDELCLADIVMTSTGSQEPLVTAKLLKEVMKRRRGKRLLIVDVAVPRDVEASAGKVNNVYLYDIDDLHQLAAENLKQREAEVPQAEKIIESAQGRYLSWEESLAIVPTIKALRTRLEDIRQAGVAQYVHKVPNLDEKGKRCIEQMTQTIVNRILHEPQIRLRSCGGPGDGQAMAESLRYLFGLDGTAGNGRT